MLLVKCHYDFFFFQAEDGIRDLVRSRGLGDVYKRQPAGHRGKLKRCARGRFPAARMRVFAGVVTEWPKAVSYTHLTLPTSDLV